MSDVDDDPFDPAAQTRLIGHAEEAQALADAASSGRLPHAWLLTGPSGIGKLTLAFRFARHLLGGDTTVSKDLNGPSQAPDSKPFRLVRGRAHPDLLLMQRPQEGELAANAPKRSQELSVEDVRKIPAFLSLSASDGGYRIVIVDEVDRLNRNAANALLKCLEEPPAKAVLILTAVSAGRLLPTIRSRCRRLQLSALNPDEMAEWISQSGEEFAGAADLIDLAGGSPGQLCRLADNNAGDLQRQIGQLFVTNGRFDWTGAHKLSEALSKRGAEATFEIGSQLLSDRLQSEIIAGARAANGNLDRLVKVWEKAQELTAAAQHANLDKRTVLLQIFAELESAQTRKTA